jgi:hypothetical protein
MLSMLKELSLESFGGIWTMSARGSHALPPLLAHGFTRRNKWDKKYGDLDQLSLLFLPMPAVRAIITCKTRKNTQIIDFIIF